MLTYADFTGYHKIAQDTTTQELLTAFIVKYEQKYLVDLLGYDLYLLFIDDLNAGVPVSQRFTVIYNALKNPNSSSNWIWQPKFRSFRNSLYDEPKPKTEALYSEGIKEMLKGFIYAEFINEYGYEVSQVGIVVNQNENSEKTSVIPQTEARFNKAVNSFTVIRNYILDNPADYPEYEGIEINQSYWGGAF